MTFCVNSTCVECRQRVDGRCKNQLVCSPQNTCVPCTASEADRILCSYVYTSDAGYTAPGCNTATGRCVPCLANQFCRTGVPGVGLEGEGYCASDNTTCVLFTCTSDDQCQVAGHACDPVHHYCMETG